jgi:ABC-type multidrug transport system fused ATPase/permease subunit
MNRLIKDFYSVLGQSKFSLYKIIFLNFLFSLIELLSLALLVPIIFIFKDIDKFKFIFFEITGFKFLIDKNQNEIFIYFLILIFFIFILKFIFLLIITIKKNNFFRNITEVNVKKTFSYFISQDPNFYINNSMASLFHSLEEVRVFFQNTLFNILLIIQDVLLALVLLIFLLIVDFQATFFITTFLVISSLLIFFFSKKKLVFLGEEKFNSTKELLNIYKEGILGFREIKIFKARNFFLDKIKFFLKKYTLSYYKLELIKFLPKNLYEIFAVILLLLIFHFLYNASKDFDHFLLKLSIYLLTFLRLLPLANRLVLNLQTLKSGSYSYNKIKKYLINDNLNLELNKKSLEQQEIKRDIEFKNVDFSYDDKVIFKGLNIKLDLRETIAILGSSGSGKTTFIDLLLGFLKPKSGSILVDNKELKEKNSSWLENFSYVPQKILLNNSTIKSNIAYGIKDELIDEYKIQEAIKGSKLNLSSKNENIENVKISDFGNNISVGQIQRIGIARALYKDSKILIFDEATSSLDEENENGILKTIKDLNESGKMIIFITHKKKIAEKFDKILNLEKGKLIEKD